jgi:hypothetical protein
VSETIRIRPRVVAHYGQTQTLQPKKRATDVRVVLVSDTHNVQIDPALFPEGDLLLHAGDHTIDGTKEQLERAAAWLKTIATRYTYGCITIAGNHDKPLDMVSFRKAMGTTEIPAWGQDDLGYARGLFSSDGVILLHHEPFSIAGLTLFGSPYVPLSPKKQKMSLDDPARTLGFNRDDSDLDSLYGAIPPRVDILMTHTPAFGLLDESIYYAGARREEPVHIGSTVLRKWWSSREQGARPLLHVFGHEHDSRGLRYDRDVGSLLCNAAAVDGDRGVGGYVLKRGFRATVVDFRVD